MSSAPPVKQFEHWTLVATDVSRSREFYTEILGASIPDRDGGPTSVVLADTIIDIFPASSDSPAAPKGPGYHHAYLIQIEDYDRWVEHLRTHDVPIQLRSHRLHRLSIFLDDPDGHQIELKIGRAHV